MEQGFDPGCVFCKMIKGELPVKKVHEDENCIVILDIYPASPGHCIVVPKFHAFLLSQLPDNILAGVGRVISDMSDKLTRALGGGGITVFNANGQIAGQKAPHVLVHIIPRKDNDGLKLDLPMNKLAPEEHQKILETLMQTMDSLPDKEAQPAPQNTQQAVQPSPQPVLQQPAQTSPAPNDLDIDPELLAEIDALPGDKPASDKQEAASPDESEDEVDLDAISDLFGGK